MAALPVYPGPAPWLRQVHELSSQGKQGGLLCWPHPQVNQSSLASLLSLACGLFFKNSGQYFFLICFFVLFCFNILLV